MVKGKKQKHQLPGSIVGADDSRRFFKLTKKRMIIGVVSLIVLIGLGWGIQARYLQHKAPPATPQLSDEAKLQQAIALITQPKPAKTKQQNLNDQYDQAVAKLGKEPYQQADIPNLYTAANAALVLKKTAEAKVYAQAALDLMSKIPGYSKAYPQQTAALKAIVKGRY